MSKQPSATFVAQQLGPAIKQVSRILAVFAAIFVCIVALAGCGSPGGQVSGDTSTRSGSEENMSVKVGYVSTSVIPELVVAQNQGLFDGNGLTVEFVPLDGSVVDAALNSDVDFFIGDPVTLEAACVGLPVKVVDVLHTGGVQGVARFDSAIASVSDLIGKRVGVPTTGSFGRVAVEAELTYAGVNPSSVQFMPYDDNDVLRAYDDLDGGVIDALVWPDPCGEILQQAGYSRFFDSANSDLVGIDSTTYVLAAPTDAANDVGVVSSLCVALEDAAESIQQNPEETAVLLDNDESMTRYRELADMTGVATDDGASLWANMLGNYQWVQGMDYFDESVRKGILVALYASQDFRIESGLVNIDYSVEDIVNTYATEISVFGGRG